MAMAILTCFLTVARAQQEADEKYIAIYGVVLIAVMLLFPAGIQGGIRRFLGLAAPTTAGPLIAWRRQGPASKTHQEEGIS